MKNGKRMMVVSMLVSLGLYSAPNAIEYVKSVPDNSINKLYQYFNNNSPNLEKVKSKEIIMGGCRRGPVVIV